ncbi:MAG: YigZ family protein [Oscillospiraceae bacterium]|jgi:uncharacterized YigZ family protein|nr:YigZ family protein [Oscillospiraceae bacterium]
MKPYVTLAGQGRAEFTERGSRFIGVCAPVSGEDAAKEFLANVRKTHPGASHNVFAYRLRGGVTRASDDGEPSGTAGAPVLEVLTRREVLDAALVVTRYFGGTLLGAGGLVRAYSRAASAAADAAGVAEMRLWREGAAAVPYALYDSAMRLLERFFSRDVSSDFGADVVIRFLVPGESWEEFCAALRELSSGASVPECVRELYLA